MDNIFDDDAEYVDALVEYMRELIRKQEELVMVYVGNKSRMKEMNHAIKEIKYLISKERMDSQLECHIDDMIKCGIVNIHAHDSFETSELVSFCKGLQHASNVEVNVTRKNLNIDLMFYGIFESEYLS